MAMKISYTELKEYQDKFGKHHPFCDCPKCTKKRLDKPILHKLWRLFIMGKEREPKVYVKEKDKYVCPACLEEMLSYNEEERMFICGNCKKAYALTEVD